MGKLYYICIFNKSCKIWLHGSEWSKSGFSFCCVTSLDCMWAWGLLHSGNGRERPLLINWHSFPLSSWPLCCGVLSVLGSAALGRPPRWLHFSLSAPGLAPENFAAVSKSWCRVLCLWTSSTIGGVGVIQTQLTGSMLFLNIALVTSSQNEAIKPWSRRHPFSTVGSLSSCARVLKLFPWLSECLLDFLRLLKAIVILEWFPGWDTFSPSPLSYSHQPHWRKGTFCFKLNFINKSLATRSEERAPFLLPYVFSDMSGTPKGKKHSKISLPLGSVYFCCLLLHIFLSLWLQV